MHVRRALQGDHLGVRLVARHFSKRALTLRTVWKHFGRTRDSSSSSFPTPSLGPSDSPPAKPGSASAEEEPEPPGESECCGNGCDDCVWIEYWERLEDFKARQKERAQAAQQGVEEQGSRHREERDGS
ncbi:hypothetical protein NSK_005999 [Nannochloropsis salina CCMP1776]|uniref:Oxidoreductase-like domain-containing protein n=1 Tax=Nannochloropsis salina CCMP1776 TaxID=1027361 RepID=A0A4D9CYB1_9STRA|nr:hypothetical protein NSK_005999 [Nannochloropsis salina CCMP1776]|eukprot:TFJ82573.1 hypothetical protein NSK_005999 [Nannochloropsis salina CCMP1776]